MGKGSGALFIVEKYISSTNHLASCYLLHKQGFEYTVRYSLLFSFGTCWFLPISFNVTLLASELFYVCFDHWSKA